MKRCFDVLVSGAALLFFSPLFLLVAAAIRVDSRGPIFFRQERVGLNFVPFRIIKFRTMVPNAGSLGGPLTKGEHDPRITRVGRLLRATKLDELPQLFNVLAGDMSLVGPRPEVWKYVNLFRDDYARLLTVRPGITDPASIFYRHEADVLGTAVDPERTYVEQVLPDKIRRSSAYVADVSLKTDLGILAQTVRSLVAR